jgi:hypothetical protein
VYFYAMPTEPKKQRRARVAGGLTRPAKAATRSRAGTGPRTGAVAVGRQVLAGLRAMGPGGLRYLERAIARASVDREVTYTREVGRTEVIRVIGVPALLDRADAPYLHGVCSTLLAVFGKTVAARRHDPAVHAALPLHPAEEEWHELSPVGAAPVAARWDMNIDPARGGARAATLFEVNGCAVGGIHYATMASEILLQLAAPLADAGALALPSPFRGLWHDLLGEHGARFGHPRPRIAWLEDRSWDTGITEGPSLATHLNHELPRADVADPRDLELRRGAIWSGGMQRDVLYRSIEVRDLVELEAQQGRLLAMREAFRRGIVVSPPEGDLDHKSMLEVWSSPRFDHLYTDEERAVLRRHVPWTRLLGERRTDGPPALGGREVDLPEFTRRQRARLVIKPNRACGGHGVLLGPDTSAGEWERAIARALSGEEPAVVQSLVASARILAPVVRGRRITDERHYTTYGLFATPAGLGFLGRAAPFPVVNVSKGGGLLGVLLA